MILRHDTPAPSGGLAVAPTLLSTLLAVSSLPASASGDDADAWWRQLQALCGQAFSGELIRAPEGDTGFHGQALVMHVRECGDERIRIPFLVGDDRSRTWVLTRAGGRIELKHDHRREDGEPDAVTMYGGTSSNAGDAITQVFPADDDTRRLLPGSGLRSVWLIDIEPGERFVYGAHRLGTDRAFRIDFDLRSPVPAPPAPWGWDGAP